jgi:hypothetical protein
MMARGVPAVLAIVAMAVGHPATPAATVLVPADLGELSREARLIARGRVVQTEGVWNGDWRSIETIVTLEIEAALKGVAGASVQFRVPGGRFGRYRRVFLGAPVFPVGQHVVVFLGGTGREPSHLLGLSQGVFRVVAADGGWVVTPPALVAPANLPQPILRGDPSRRVQTLEAFEQQVRALARSPE